MVDTARHEAAESDSVIDHDALCALMGQPAGGAPLDLGAPFKVLPSGVYFAPDPHAWRLLEPSEQAALAPPEGLGERVDAEGINPHWRRVLPFPFTARQLLQFAEYAMLPALCELMEREAWHPPLREDPALRALDCWPRARALALFLAGGPDPDEREGTVAPGPRPPRKRGHRKGSKAEAFVHLLAQLHPSMPVARINALLPEPMDESKARALARQFKGASKKQ